MFGKLRSQSLILASWQIVKKDKRIILSQIIGAVMWLIVFAIGAFAVYNLGTTSVVTGGDLSTSFEMGPLGIVLSLFLYILLAIISHIFSAFIFILSLARIRGESISSSVVFKRLKRRLKAVVLFSILSSTVGLVLNILQDRIPYFGGKLLAWLGSVAWAIASMFGLAVAVDKGESNPIKAVEESAGIVKKTFGDNIRVNFVLLPFIFLLIIATLLLSGLTGFLITNAGLPSFTMIVATGVVFIISFVLVMSITAAIQAVIQAGLYEYAVSGKTPENFNAEMFKQIITQKKARKIFGRG